SQEAELRLEHTFQRHDLLPEVLSLAFGDRIAGLLIMMGMAMASAAWIGPAEQGRRRLFQDDWWASDPVSYENAILAAKFVLDSARPKGGTSITDIDDANVRLCFQAVSALIETVSAKKRGHRGSEDAVRGSLVDAIIRLLGPVAARMGDDSNIF